ncbi:MAG: class I SAM-dependent methyltransferase [Candidatus Bathyarchaeota archaeon]|nr:class I SAM-dependent methyltransferase [Candidatus Bathyarchaeum sp.]
MLEWKEKRSNMQHYDRQATIYNVQYAEEQDTKIVKILKNIELDSNEFVLDLGCGTGFLFRHIKKQVIFLVGLDLSKKALKEAKKYTKNMTNIALILADADNTPFQDHTFDKVFAITLLQNMPDFTKTLSEIKRVSKSQATFALTGFKKTFSQEGFVALLERERLKVSLLEPDEQLKGHVAVCTKADLGVPQE